MRLQFDQLGSDERGVQWTLEAFLAVLLLMGSLIAVLEATSFGSPQSEDQVERTQLTERAEDVITLAAEDSLLREAILYWDSGVGEYIDTDTVTSYQPHYTSFPPSDSFPLAPLLRNTFDEQRIAYNLELEYENAAGSTSPRLLIYQGPPGGQSVTVSTSVTLSDSDKPAVTPNDCTLLEIHRPGVCTGESYYIPDVSPESGRYNVVQIRLEVWRI